MGVNSGVEYNNENGGLTRDARLAKRPEQDAEWALDVARKVHGLVWSFWSSRLYVALRMLYC
jgi:hypothetical protein